MSSTRKTIGAREFKTRLGTYLSHVRGGGTIIVTERGTPVAEVRPLPIASVESGRALRELVARGVLGGELRERPRLGDFEPVTSTGAPVSEAVIEDREDRF